MNIFTDQPIKINLDNIKWILSCCNFRKEGEPRKGIALTYVEATMGKARSFFDIRYLILRLRSGQVIWYLKLQLRWLRNNANQPTSTNAIQLPLRW